MTPIARETTAGSAATHRAVSVKTAASFVINTSATSTPANDTALEGSSGRSILTARGKRRARRMARNS